MWDDYKWSGTEYQSKGAKDLKQEVKFGKLKLPTKATLNLYGSKLFYFSGGTNAIYCYDLETQKHVCVEVPYQIIGGKKIWDYTDIVYTKGIFDSQGRAVRKRRILMATLAMAGAMLILPNHYALMISFIG